jgi:uncharacterized protein YcfJ
MNKVCTGVAVLLVGFSGLSAATAADFEDYARVVSVAPQVEQVNYPQQECHTEYVSVQRHGRGIGGSIIGGVAGGILGNQVGGGNGRTVATAAGAIAGAIVGDRVENNQPNAVEQQPVQQCRTVDNWQTRTRGYTVTYEYHGHRQTSVMPYDPGERLRVQVAVMPRL